MNAFVKALQTQLRQCVVLSTIYWISQCVADKKLDIYGKDDDFVHIYTPKPPKFRPIDNENGSSIARVWIILLGVLGGIVIVITCFFCFFALQRFFRGSHGGSPVSNPPVGGAVVFHPPPSAPAMEERDSWNRGSGRSEVPPEYTSVVLQRLNAPEQPQQKLETPPPEYITVPPFQ